MARLKAVVERGVSRLVTSPRLQAWERRVRSWPRRLAGGDAVLHYFHQADDPYSRLCAPLLPALQARYRVRVVCHPVPAPDAAAAPDRTRLQDWSARDAARLAAAFGLASADVDAGPAVPNAPHDLAAGAQLRRRLGHYLGATFFFEGEWYWGVDRLHHLERRLVDAGFARSATAVADGPLVAPPALQWRRVAASRPAPQLHFFGSLRSPYTHLAIAQARRLAEHYGAALQLRFVLPMVMRGLPVPRAKRLYILRDAQREGERLGLPFGCVVDPVGTPTEQGLAVLHHAIALGRGPGFAESFLQGVFADGIDAGDRRGLDRIAARAGLSASTVDAALADPTWRAVAETNRAELLARGLWGVPSFRIDERPMLWGQDRLWMLEQDLLDTIERGPGRS